MAYGKTGIDPKLVMKVYAIAKPKIKKKKKNEKKS
tara:strand:+ start:3490 stop:3594 length:105 start_codon:yes stop_codon:yes gene_type:complete